MDSTVDLKIPTFVSVLMREFQIFSRKLRVDDFFYLGAYTNSSQGISTKIRKSWDALNSLESNKNTIAIGNTQSILLGSEKTLCFL